VGVRDSLLVFIQAVLSGFIGYRLGSDEREVRWVLTNLAGVLAIVSWYRVFIKLTGIGGELEFLQPAWPASFVFAFGYCWYMNDFLTKARPGLWTIFALGGTGLAILLDFHKPMVFTFTVCSLILFFAAARSSNVFKVSYRIILLGVVAIIGFAVVDQITSNKVSTRIAEIVEKKFLHKDSGKEAENFWESVDKASGGRFIIWTQAFGRFAEQPFFGWGPGVHFETESMRDEMAKMAAEGEVPLHNVYLEILVSVGVVGLLPYLAGIFWWYRLMLKKIVLRRVGFFLVPCTAYVTGILAFDSVDSAGGFFAIASLLLFLMGLTAKVAENSLKSPQTVESPVAQKALAQANSARRPDIGFRPGRKRMI
jgi:hypothetical protein